MTDREFTATVYNINFDKNKELLDSCRPLKGYSFFVDRVRKYSRDMSMEEAVDKAVRECIEADYLKDVLSEERAAVMLEMLTNDSEQAVRGIGSVGTAFSGMRTSSNPVKEPFHDAIE